ncbi:hypothetical protein NW762_010082 [Fusarium torreyae]|uniref:Uncharacterized protein n=1 Tax=Fusarium torreyae TaxID=1237075 RepID=A0A9W8RV93_9HYPO|nr:hypothetical protein NW762_010082 [Fusarium torreyae]
MSSYNNNTPHERTRQAFAPVSEQGEPSMSPMATTPTPISSMPAPPHPATSSMSQPPLVVSSTPRPTFSILPPPATIMHPPWCPRGHPAGLVHTTFNPQNPVRQDYPPLDSRVDVHWPQNVGRVLGPEYVGVWPNLDSMVNEFEMVFRQNQGRVAALGRQWNLRELETAARLRAWRVPDWALAFLLGSPSTVPGPYLLNRFASWAHDEMWRLEQVNRMM